MVRAASKPCFCSKEYIPLAASESSLVRAVDCEVKWHRIRFVLVDGGAMPFRIVLSFKLVERVFPSKADETASLANSICWDQ